jgi:hypothetical protein
MRCALWLTSCSLLAMALASQARADSYPSLRLDHVRRIALAAPESVRELQDKPAEIASARLHIDRATATAIVRGAEAVIIGGGVLVLLFARRPAPCGHARLLEPTSPPASGSTAPGAATSLPTSLIADFAVGLTTGEGLVAAGALTQTLLKSGDHEASSPPVGEVAWDHRETDDLDGPVFGVSRGRAWDEDDQTPKGDDGI